MLTERIAMLDVNGHELAGLRITFDIQSGYQNQVKRAFFSVYNMAESTRNGMNPDDPVTFSILDKAGQLSKMFYGHLSAFSQDKESDGSEVTRLYCWSGNSDYTRKKRSVAFEKGALGDDVLNWIKENIAPIEVNVSADARRLISAKSYPKGYRLDGEMFAIINQFSKDIGTSSVLDDTQLFIGGVSETIHEVSSKSDYGMVGIPGITTLGVEVKTELNPTARVEDFIDVIATYYTLMSSDSDQVSLNHRNPNGVYRVININQNGDTHGEQWFTTYEGILREQP